MLKLIVLNVFASLTIVGAAYAGGSHATGDRTNLNPPETQNIDQQHFGHPWPRPIPYCQAVEDAKGHLIVRCFQQ